ncbi:TetR/AcrR family transcriptional regulator [Microbacterium aquimaris]|uniref:TetR/AcrR family transcriptional regulator n=1 Tax=Microbacterium aquimaris TaxID=459816 RepID=UPI002AD58AC4|nr:TetR/AcrR family transcriptional regulator [Microbacterium aquimaris]MDZ8275223.1 TetR/AcrR family transcriptional regulator [Microbacterium aquimaris]
MPSRAVGRPPVRETTEALRRAAEAIMEDEGFSRLTVGGLVKAAGTTRPTFYRRYASTAHVAFDVIAHRFGDGNPVDTGSLDGDILQLQREEVEMFSTALVRKNLPGLLEVVRTDPAVREMFQSHFILPRRANVGDVVAAGAARGEVPPASPDAVEVVCDLLLGPILARALLPIGQPLDGSLAVETTRVALAYLRGRC